MDGVTLYTAYPIFLKMMTLRYIKCVMTIAMLTVNKSPKLIMTKTIICIVKTHGSFFKIEENMPCISNWPPY